MSETAVAPASAKKAPKAKRASGAKKAAKPASHPTFQAMTTQAIKNLKEKGGSSQRSILKYILANYKVGPDAVKVNNHLRVCLRRARASGVFLAPHGAAGKYKLSESKAAKAKTAKRASPKKKTSKPKKTGTPKTAATKKTAKSPKPKKTKKSPAKKPAAKKAKKATPKKAAKSKK